MAVRFSSVFEVCLSVNPARRSAARAARIAQMPTAIPDPQAATAYNRHATLNEWQVLGADIAVWNVRNVRVTGRTRHSSYEAAGALR